MDSKVRYSECPNEETAKVAEAAKTGPEVIPFVSPEKAAQVFSSQRRQSLEEGWDQVRKSLGRSNGSD